MCADLVVRPEPQRVGRRSQTPLKRAGANANDRRATLAPLSCAAQRGVDVASSEEANAGQDAPPVTFLPLMSRLKVAYCAVKLSH